ncbi:dihydrofolate reductase [Pediococcus pentosaceus]
MIWAEDLRHGIGKQQSIPWHIPGDMAFFKKTTSGNTVVMGRKTFDSIGKALPKPKKYCFKSSSNLITRFCSWRGFIK